MVEQNNNSVVILVTIANYGWYKSLKDNNMLPLIIKLQEQDKQEFESERKYIPLEDEDNSYILDINYLKTINSDIKKTLIFDDAVVVQITRFLNEYETENNKKGIMVKGNPNFYSMQKLAAIAKNQEEKQYNIENIDLLSQVSNFREYQIFKSNHRLPIAIRLTDYEYEVVSKPFDGLYVKVRNNKDDNLLVIDPFILKTMITNKVIYINSIELIDGTKTEVNDVYGVKDDLSLGGFFINDEYLDIEDYVNQILEQETKNKRILNKIDDSMIFAYWI